MEECDGKRASANTADETERQSVDGVIHKRKPVVSRRLARQIHRLGGGIRRRREWIADAK